MPERPATWLDLVDEDHVEVHAALPMRYYLETEQAIGIRLAADHAPLPRFHSEQQARPFHVVLVRASSWTARKDYGSGFAAIIQTLVERRPASWEFTTLTGEHDNADPSYDGVVLKGLDAADCLDVFASAELVIGNDTGLTHLAALTERPDRTSPQVVGLYGRHAHSKWTTGFDHHHAVATPFSQLLAAADRCPVRDGLDDAVWGNAAAVAGLPAALIADFAGRVAGWWT